MTLSDEPSASPSRTRLILTEAPARQDASSRQWASVVQSAADGLNRQLSEDSFRLHLCHTCATLRQTPAQADTSWVSSTIPAPAQPQATGPMPDVICVGAAPWTSMRFKSCDVLHVSNTPPLLTHIDLGLFQTTPWLLPHSMPRLPTRFSSSSSSRARPHS
jgi:hypothetical protein